MFLANRVANAMNARLPSYDRPICLADGCTTKLDEPRPIHVEPQGAPGIMRAHCLAKCPACGAQYKGERIFSIGKTSKAIEQDFHTYGEDDRLFIQPLLAKLQANQGKLREIQAMPVRG